MAKKKKTRRPARARRRADGGVRTRLLPVPACSVSPGEDPVLAELRGADVGWLRFLPPSAADVLDAERPLAELFDKVPADEPMWTWPEDLEEGSTEDLVRDEYPYLDDDDVAMLVAEWDAEDNANRTEKRRRFTALCDALGMPEPQGTFADLYQFCLLIGIAEEREVCGQPWVFPTPRARDILEALPADSTLAADERACRERETSQRAWEADWMRYGEHAARITGLFDDRTTGGPVTTSIQRLARLLNTTEDSVRHALAHLTSPIPWFDRAHMSCTADPLTVPAHRVITLAMDWEARDLSEGLIRSTVV